MCFSYSQRTTSKLQASSGSDVSFSGPVEEGENELGFLAFRCIGGFGDQGLGM